MKDRWRYETKMFLREDLRSFEHELLLNLNMWGSGGYEFVSVFKKTKTWVTVLLRIKY